MLTWGNKRVLPCKHTGELYRHGGVRLKIKSGVAQRTGVVQSKYKYIYVPVISHKYSFAWECIVDVKHDDVNTRPSIDRLRCRANYSTPVITIPHLCFGARSSS